MTRRWASTTLRVMTPALCIAACISPADDTGLQTPAADTASDVVADDTNTNDTALDDSAAQDTAAAPAPDTRPPAPCEGVICDTPPAPTCNAGNAVISFSETGVCDQGDCDYATFVTPCETPPDDTCSDAGTVRYYEQDGNCTSGECSYGFVEEPCDVPPLAFCDDESMLVSWQVDGSCVDGRCEYTSEVTDCGPAGCCEDHCCVVVPSNEELFGGLSATALILGPPNGLFDTEVDCVGDSSLGVCEVLPGSDDSEANLCVCRADDISITNLRLIGPNGLVLLAQERITVEGLLDASAVGQLAGPGRSKRYTTGAEGIAAGGAHNGSGGGSSSLAAYGDPSVVPLYGGMHGQGFACDASAGGGGGGALQLTAGGSITVSGTIDVSGGGGAGGASGGCRDGGGGGSGGSVLLEAPLVSVNGRLGANGGGGGGGAAGCGGGGWTAGADGDDGNATSGGDGAGGVNQGCAIWPGQTNGGDGGDGEDALDGPDAGESADSHQCLGYSCNVGAGGGGGAKGRIRINTRADAQGCACNGSFSPAPSFGLLVVE